MATVGREVRQVAEDLADALYEDYGSRKESLALAARAPTARRELVGPAAASRRAASTGRTSR